MKNIIFLDLDFTLLKSDRTISAKTIHVLNQCRKRDIFIAFATSRGVTNINHLVELIKPDIIISNGGATVHYQNQLIYNPKFSVEQTNILLNNIYLEFGDNIEITVDTSDNFYWNRTYDKSENYASDALYHNMNNFPFEAVKICVKTVVLSRMQKVAELVPSADIIRFSDIPWCKISHGNATKAKSIQFLSTYFSIQPENFIAFGDDFSDLEMLKTCGIGVAMGNAIPEVKQAADYITLSCDQDGVAWWLEKNVLI